VTTTPLLSVEALQVRYGAIEAVTDASITVMPGEFVGVIGSNGAGKSSTMRAIAGVMKPAGGRVLFDGSNVTGRRAHEMVRLGVAMVPEGRMIFGDQTVRENLLFGAFSRVKNNDLGVEQDIEEVLDLFPRLRERLNQLGGSLSGGEQQMLAIARGLLSKPRLLIVDELSLGLAPKILDMLFPILAKLNKGGLSILLVEQMASYALDVTARTYVMENGRTLFSGPSRELSTDDRVLDAYLGRHRNN
jgi:branched-chain amino acid transport system ATP-binding protein